MRASSIHAYHFAGDAFAGTMQRGQFGLALLDEQLRVAWRRGDLCAWLPGEDTPVCASPLLCNMEDRLIALQAEGGEIVLASMRAPGILPRRVTISIVWDAPHRRYVVVTTPDHGGDQVDHLLASERREKRLLEQQAAAAAARLQVASSLYRDIVESSGDLVLRFAPDLRVGFANERAARFFDVRPEELFGTRIDTLFPSRAGEAPWAIQLHAGRPASFELPARDAAGKIRWFWWDVRWSGAGAGGEFQAVGRDVTEVRRLRAERDKANEEARAAAIGSERLRIANDLHDTLVRSIVTLIGEMRLIARQTGEEATREALAELDIQARNGLSEARAALTWMRTASQGCDPTGILASFKRCSANVRDVDIHADLPWPMAELPAATGEALCRILREALRNIELHSDARRVEIDLRRRDDHIRLDIRDDGVGFDPAAPRPDHYGLIGMKERAELVGARLEIASAPNEGAHVTLIVPLA